MKKVIFIIGIVFLLPLACATNTHTIYQSKSINPALYKKVAVGFFIEEGVVDDPLAIQYMTDVLLKGLQEKNVQLSYFSEYFKEFKKETPNYDTLSLEEKASSLLAWELKNFDLKIIPRLRIYQTTQTPIISGIGGLISSGYVDSGIVALEILIVDKNKEIIWHFFDKKFSQGSSAKELGAIILNNAIKNMPF